MEKYHPTDFWLCCSQIREEEEEEEEANHKEKTAANNFKEKTAANNFKGKTAANNLKEKTEEKKKAVAVAVPTDDQKQKSSIRSSISQQSNLRTYPNYYHQTNQTKPFVCLCCSCIRRVIRSDPPIQKSSSDDVTRGAIPVVQLPELMQMSRI